MVFIVGRHFTLGINGNIPNFPVTFGDCRDCLIHPAAFRRVQSMPFENRPLTNRSPFIHHSSRIYSSVNMNRLTLG